MLTQDNMHPYQRDIANFIVNHSGSFVVAEMGLGKTAPTAIALHYLQKERGLGPVLVLAPLRVIYNSWPTEFSKWEPLQKANYHILHGAGKDIVHHPTKIRKQDFILANFETLPFIEKNNLWKYFSALVVDESSMIKNSKTKRFKTLKKAAGRFKKRVLLTGTPSPSGELWELFAQMYIVDIGARLGDSPWHFKNRYYEKTDFMGYDYSLRGGARDIITAKCSDVTITLKAKDWLKLPPVIFNTVPVSLPEKALTLYKEMEKEFLVELESDVITAANAAVKSAKLRQITAGGIYHEGRQEYTLLHEEKADALQEITDGTDSNVLCCFQFRFEKTILKRRFPQAKFIDGTTGTAESTSNINAWNNGGVKLLCCHPQSVGHGLNLQAGGNVIVWLSPDWSLERTQQMNARLYRQGQKNKVFIHRIVAKNSVDEAVIDALSKKNIGQHELIDMLKQYGKAKRRNTA